MKMKVNQSKIFKLMSNFKNKPNLNKKEENRKNREEKKIYTDFSAEFADDFKPSYFTNFFEKLKEKLKINKVDLFYIFLVFGGILFNFLITYFLIKNNIFVVENTKPLGLPINLFVQFFITIFIILGIFNFRFYINFPASTALILAGSLSNLIERFLFGNVKDYIPLPSGYANLADFQLWFGLFLLNFQLWILPKNGSKNESKNKSEIEPKSESENQT